MPYRPIRELFNFLFTIRTPKPIGGSDRSTGDQAPRCVVPGRGQTNVGLNG
jgi:hypothetical protein